MIKKISAGLSLAIMTAALDACTGSPSSASFVPSGTVSGQSHQVHRMDAGTGGGPATSGTRDDAGTGGGPAT